MLSRENAYRTFNFVVQFGSDKSSVPHAGFQECRGIVESGKEGIHIETDAERQIQKVTGMNKSSDVTLKRGVISADALNAWLNDVRAGSSVRRDVILTLQSEDPGKPSRRWNLLRARIIKYTTGPLNAKGTDVAIAELVLSCERIQPE
jgi:phage tail-like protein